MREKHTISLRGVILRANLSDSGVLLGEPLRKEDIHRFRGPVPQFG